MHRIGHGLAKKQFRRIDGRSDQGVHAIVGQFARKTAAENQAAGESENDPQQSSGDFLHLLGVRVERKTEEQQNNQGKRKRSVDSVLATDFGAQILVCNRHGVSQEIHASP